MPYYKTSGMACLVYHKLHSIIDIVSATEASPRRGTNGFHNHFLCTPFLFGHPEQVRMVKDGADEDVQPMDEDKPVPAAIDRWVTHGTDPSYWTGHHDGSWSSSTFYSHDDICQQWEGQTQGEGPEWCSSSACPKRRSLQLAPMG